MKLKRIRGPEDTDPIITLEDNGRLTLPSEAREAFGLEAGDSLEVVVFPEGILLCPVTTEAEMEAFWGPDWRQKVDEADADVAAGRTTFYASTEEFLASLDARSNADPRRDR